MSGEKGYTCPNGHNLRETGIHWVVGMVERWVWDHTARVWILASTRGLEEEVQGPWCGQCGARLDPCPRPEAEDPSQTEPAPGPITLN